VRASAKGGRGGGGIGDGCSGGDGCRRRRGVGNIII